MKPVSMKTWATLLAVVLGSGVAIAAQAGERAKEMKAESPLAVVASKPAMIERASSIIGMAVKDKTGNEIGRVRDIVLAPEHGKIAYLAFLPYGSSLTDEKFARAPIEKVALSPDRTYFIYDMPKDVVAKDAAILDPALPWTQKVSTLLDLTVLDAAKQPAGKIRNLLIDIPNHCITKATIGTGGVLGYREKLASVDWVLINLHQADLAAYIGMTSEQLRGIAYKADSYWEQLGFAGDEKKAPDSPKLDEKSYPDGSTPIDVPKEDQLQTPFPPIKF